MNAKKKYDKISKVAECQPDSGGEGGTCAN